MLTILKELFLSSKFRKWIIGGVVIVILLLSGAYGYHSIYESGYSSGVNAEKVVYQKEVDKQAVIAQQAQKKADEERTTLNNTITSLKTDNTALQEKADKQYQTEQETINNYVKNDKNSTTTCFPASNDGMHILNQSFPN